MICLQIWRILWWGMNGCWALMGWKRQYKGFWQLAAPAFNARASIYAATRGVRLYRVTLTHHCFLTADTKLGPGWLLRHHTVSIFIWSYFVIVCIPKKVFKSHNYRDGYRWQWFYIDQPNNLCWKSDRNCAFSWNKQTNYFAKRLYHLRKVSEWKRVHGDDKDFLCDPIIQFQVSEWLRMTVESVSAWPSFGSWNWSLP